VPERIKTYGSPDGVTLYHSEVMMSFLGRVIFYGLEIKEESPINTKYLLDGVYSTVKIMQGYCAFVSFCSSLLIATLSDEKYHESLLDMMCFFLYNFHNAYIFRIEIPDAPLKEKLSVVERGSEAHTTRMKIYLYDRNRVPYVVRVDMPHKGSDDENKLHFNVETLDGKSALNHQAIDCCNSNPSDLLNVMIENMRRISPGILNIKDSYKEDDRRMLEMIIRGYGGGPVGLETLASAIGEESVTLEDVCEPFLMQLGFLGRTPRGRVATKLAYEHLGFKLPDQSDGASEGQLSF
jgi:hypothetical protein